MVIRTSTRRNVRILLVGEQGVGKTSLILSLVSEEFPEYVPSKAEEITIPADVTPEQVPTNIVDYSAVEQTDENLTEEIQKANVVCVVYAVDDEESMEQITTYWLPLIRECHPGNHCPVVLVGNKIDLIEYSTIDDVLAKCGDYPEIESCIECSAKTLNNISEMFYYAQKAVLHPTAPLYIVEKQDLTDACKNALIRIFKVCDIDCDGLLNDIELNNFQRCCFNAPLLPQVLDDVKAVLRETIEDGICENSVTMKGFLVLHCLFIQRGRNETTWTVLRKFGYNDNLNMSKEYLHPMLKVPSGCTTELSHRGHQFLTHLFARHDKDKDGALSPRELKELFSTCPAIPWGSDMNASVVTNERGWITYQGYMCQWALMALTDVHKSLEYLAYLGFNVYENESQVTAITVTREKKLDLAKKQSSRNVYQCHVIGPTGSGKTSFCRSFIRNGIDILPTAEITGHPTFVVNVVQVYGQEKMMVLREIDIKNVSDPLLPHEVQCDVACLLYDTTNEKSFEYAARIYIKYFAESKIPVLIVANKSDATEVRQEYLYQPSSFCSKYKILPPHPFSSKGHLRKDVFVKLATMAAFPPLRRMVHMLLLRPKPSEWFSSFYRHLRQFGLVPGDSTVWWKAGLGLVAATAVGFIVVRVLNTDKLR